MEKHTSQYHIRTAVREDLPYINQCYADARAFMKVTGNPNQWGDTKPFPELIEKDLELAQSFVVLDESEAVKGIFAFIIGADPTYGRIDDGAWLNNEPYGTIHRIAGAAGAHGIFAAALDFCSKRASNIRIDTHHDNKVMQHQIEKYGFTRCGIIYLENGDPRIAYQKVIR